MYRAADVQLWNIDFRFADRGLSCVVQKCFRSGFSDHFRGIQLRQLRLRFAYGSCLRGFDLLMAVDTQLRDMRSPGCFTYRAFHTQLCHIGFRFAYRG